MWIPTSKGSYVNSDHVIEISPDHSGEKTILYLTNEKTAVARGDAFEITMGLNPIVPAQPGFEVLYLGDPGDEPAFGREPIIAWCIDPDNFSSKVAISPSGSTLRPSDGVAILYPDGQVTTVDERTFPNVDAWVAGEHKAKAKLKAEKAS